MTLTYLSDFPGASIATLAPDAHRALYMGYFAGPLRPTLGAAECDAIAAWGEALERRAQLRDEQAERDAETQD